MKNNAKYCINIKHGTRVSLDERVQDEKWANNMFAPAQKEIFYLMKTDSYPRFLESEVFIEIENDKETEDMIKVNGDHSVGNASKEKKLEEVKIDIVSPPVSANNSSKGVKAGNTEVKKRKGYLKLFGRNKKGKTPSPVKEQPDNASQPPNYDLVEKRGGLGVFKVVLQLSPSAGDAELIRTTLHPRENDTLLETLSKFLDRQQLHSKDVSVFLSDTGEKLSWETSSAKVISREIKLWPNKDGAPVTESDKDPENVAFV